MAIKRIKTARGLSDRLAKGIIDSVDDLRNNILNPAEINYLTLRETQIDSLFRLLNTKSLDELGISENKKILFETNLASADEFGDTGYLIESNTTYRILKQYVDILNLELPPEKQYHLGHETGVFTVLLKLLKEAYTPEPGSVQKNAIIARQKLLLDQALKASIIIDSVDEKTILKMRTSGQISSGSSAKDLETVLKAAGFPITLETSVDRKLSTSIQKSEYKVALSAELSSANSITGNLSGNLSRMLRKAFNSNSTKKTAIDKILAEVDLFEMTGSPSIKTELGDMLENHFLGKKHTKRKQTKVRTTRRSKANNSSAIALKRKYKQRVRLLKTKVLAAKVKKKFVVPTVTLKALINEFFSRFIQDRMKSSNVHASKAYLRYQTGTFADSALLLSLNREQTGAYRGIYTYAKDPYEVYEKGQLATPGRSPELYIEGAARSIAQQVLKKQFKGIFLESN